MTRQHHSIEILLSLDKLDPIDRRQIGLALSKLSEEDKTSLSRAIDLLESESALIGYLSAQNKPAKLMEETT